jgi:predicted dehydrogenase
MANKTNSLSRRDFLKTGSVAAAGLMLGGLGAADALAAPQRRNAKAAPAPSQRVRLACIGIGNRGWDIVRDMSATGLCEIVALCDVDLDAGFCQNSLKANPGAKRYRDFRKMFDEMAGEFDAVTVAIPDFAHFPAVMLAMSMGKHVYVEKPMCRTFHEARLMMDMARRNPHLATQVGNQGHSEGNYFQFKAWQDAGIIKDVYRVDAHMNSARRWHSYDQNIRRYPEAEPLPANMDWDTWLGTAMWHDFNKKYHPGDWRSWYDFGMGALGDWGAHILDTVHEFLALGLPYEVEPTYLKGSNDFFFPLSSTIKFRFGARGAMPPVDVTWYDGVDNLPPLPAGYGSSERDPNIPPSGANVDKPDNLNPGKIIYSKDLIFKGASHGSTLSIIPADKARDMASKLPEVPRSPSNHAANFLKACRGEERTRSPFEIHGPLAQVFCLGVIAQRLGRKLVFDRHTGTIAGDPVANALLAGAPPRLEWQQFYEL